MSALATVTHKSFNGKLTAKIDFPIGYTIADADIKRLKSLHYLVSICTTYWWNLNKIVWHEQHKILNFLT